jgi:hypothetical protein
MFRSKVTKIATLALGVLTFSYISNLSITEQKITMQSAQAASDYCGPNESPAGRAATKFFLFPYNKTFDPACKEPDTYERNIKVGQTDEECVTTRGSRYSISDLGTNAQLVVRMDDYPGVAPFAVVAQISVPTTRKRDEFTAVSYSHQSRIEAYKQLLQIKSSSNR